MKWSWGNWKYLKSYLSLEKCIREHDGTLWSEGLEGQEGPRSCSFIFCSLGIKLGKWQLYLLRNNEPGVALLLVKRQMRTTEGQEAANKCGYRRWRLCLGRRKVWVVWCSSPWNAPRAQLWGNEDAPFIFPYSKKGALGVSSDSSGKVLSSYKIDFGSFVLLCNFFIRSKLFLFDRIKLYCFNLFNLIIKNESQWNWQT